MRSMGTVMAAAGAGVLVAVASVGWAAPAGAGATPCPPAGEYCIPTPPAATTTSAGQVGSDSATLNGISGPNQAGGYITTYYFSWGRTPAYGNTTASGQVGSCPSGPGLPPYCAGVPATEDVSAAITTLTPCTTYHFQIVSINPDGTSTGTDRTFTTHFAGPIARVKAPRRARHARKLSVHVTLTLAARVTIELRRRATVLKTYRLGPRGAGTFTKRISSGARTGRRTIRVSAVESCGSQTVNDVLRVF